MHFLAVSSRLNRIHHDVLRRHEGKLGAQMPVDNLRINLEPIGHIHAQVQDSVDGQEALRDGKPLVGRIIQGTLEPLYGRGNRRIQRIGNDIT